MVDSQNDFKDFLKSSIQSPKRVHPPMFMNHSKEPEVSKIVIDQEKITDDLIQEKRIKLETKRKKTVGTKFHTFTLGDVKVLAWP